VRARTNRYTAPIFAGSSKSRPFVGPVPGSDSLGCTLSGNYGLVRTSNTLPHRRNFCVLLAFFHAVPPVSDLQYTKNLNTSWVSVWVCSSSLPSSGWMQDKVSNVCVPEPITITITDKGVFVSFARELPVLKCGAADVIGV
jgi:hypothetical protein